MVGQLYSILNHQHQKIAWSQYHTDSKRAEDSTLSHNAMIPPFRDPVDTLEMEAHCMKITQNTVESLNRVCVIDQSVYAVTKEVLHRFRTMFQACFPIMGALDIEWVFLLCHGQLIQGIGLAEILNVNSWYSNCNAIY